MKLPQIQCFYGNTDLNNWIANCKPFKPKLKVNDMYIEIQNIIISDALKEHLEASQKAFNDVFNFKWL